jgi:hypothetical protein
MGKKRIIAETGAGQHGVATATVCALLGLECDVYMGEEDIRRQELNVFRMQLLGARVVPVSSGSKTLKDAINEAMRDWVTNVRTTYYMLGSVLGPHPYPAMVRDLQSVIGREARVADHRSGRSIAGCPDCVAWAEQQCHGPVSHVRSGYEDSHDRSGSRWTRTETGDHAARFSGGLLEFFTVHFPTFFRMKKAGGANAFRSAGPGLPCRRSRTRRHARHRPRRVHVHQ